MMIPLLFLLAFDPTPTPVPTPRNPPVARELAQGEKPISSGLGDIAKNRKLKANTFTVEPTDAIELLDSLAWGQAAPVRFRQMSDRDGLEWFTDGSEGLTGVWGGMPAIVFYGYENGKLVTREVLPTENCGTLRGRLEKRWGAAQGQAGSPMWLGKRTFAIIRNAGKEGCVLHLFDDAFSERRLQAGKSK